MDPHTLTESTTCHIVLIIGVVSCVDRLTRRAATLRGISDADVDVSYLSTTRQRWWRYAVFRRVFSAAATVVITCRDSILHLCASSQQQYLLNTITDQLDLLLTLDSHYLCDQRHRSTVGLEASFRDSVQRSRFMLIAILRSPILRNKKGDLMFYCIFFSTVNLREAPMTII